ncbi:hypothetical protein [Endozoicomonas lisbonensis]|uniref:DUF4136 domain-containing protein n=1 Tax=Endozoicomonas lisbonensis TaxID=3120522 RepID=A0ABV2SD12_9GAMM
MINKGSKVALALAASTLLTACASMTPTREVTEGYRIYDITGDVGSSVIAADLRTALQQNADQVRFSNSIPPHPLPETPARFTLTDPFANSSMGTLMAAQGNSMKVPECEGSTFTATSNANFQGAENTTFFVCLMPYSEGHHVNVYYNFTSVSGGFSPEDLGRTLAQSVVGDSSQFIPRIIASLETAAAKSGSNVKLLESYPN